MNIGSRKKCLFKYLTIIRYVLKACYNRTQSQIILKTLINDLKTKILFGLEVSFKCVPDNILEKLVTNCYNIKFILKHSLEIHKCLFVNQETLNKLKLSNMQWILVNVKTKNFNRLPVLHYNRIVVLDNLKEFDCFLTSTNLFNLSNCNHNWLVSMLRVIKPLIINEPKISKKASISITKPSDFIDSSDTQILLDKAIYNYFSIPKFVALGDIFKLDLMKCYPEVEYLIQPLKTSIFYIKVMELDEKITQTAFYNYKNNFYITTLTKLNEVKYSSGTYLPPEKTFSINNLKDLNLNNYNDYILDVFPDGMNGDGELLVSWIKPFIHHKHTGNSNLM